MEEFPEIAAEGCDVSIPATTEQNDLGRAARQRKAPSIFNNFVDDKSMAQELRTYSTTAKKSSVKKRSPIDHTAGSESKRSKGSTVTVQRKTKAPIVVIVKEPALSAKEKEQLEIEENFIFACREHHPKCRSIAPPLPEGPSKPMEMSAAIKKGVKECGKLLLDWNKPAAKLVGSICKVYWDGDNEWFYGRILNYDCGANRHYVSQSNSPNLLYSFACVLSLSFLLLLRVLNSNFESSISCLYRRQQSTAYHQSVGDSRVLHTTYL